MEAILRTPFQLFRLILNDVSSITKASSLQCWFQWREQVKISCSQVRIVWGILYCCHTVLCQEIIDQIRSVGWSIVMKEKSTVGSLFYGAFPSDRIPNAKDANLHFFIHSGNSCIIYKRIPGTFWGYCVYTCLGIQVATLNTGIDKSRFTVGSTRNTEFILVLYV